jgi:ribosomal protein S18 acetylase RimI-like enzyme
LCGDSRATKPRLELPVPLPAGVRPHQGGGPFSAVSAHHQFSEMFADMSTAQVQLDPMTEAEYQEFLTAAVIDYAEDKVKAGTWSSEVSLARSQAAYDELLPNGRASSGTYLFSVRDAHDNRRVAYLWFVLRGEPERKEAYVLGITVDAEFRGQGYGRAAMRACMDEARKVGAASVGLHVFAHNTVARSLYTSLGFAEVGVLMSLPLNES